MLRYLLGLLCHPARLLSPFRYVMRQRCIQERGSTATRPLFARMHSHVKTCALVVPGMVLGHGSLPTERYTTVLHPL